MRNLTPIERLEEFIIQCRQDLERYASKPNASDAAIDIKNRSLTELTEICNLFSTQDLQYLCYWKKCEAFLDIVLKDKNISSVHIILNIRENGDPARLTINEL